MRKRFQPVAGCYCSIDGTDCPIYEPSPFSGKWYSHKFKSSGLRYEVGTDVGDGNIVWICGPFPCGSHPDLKIFRSSLKTLLLNNERVITDNGYVDEKCLNRSQVPASLAHRVGRIRARHEAINGRIKKFRAVSQQFRHDKCLHSMCFHAVGKITQVLMKYEEPMFDI